METTPQQSSFWHRDRALAQEIGMNASACGIMMATALGIVDKLGLELQERAKHMQTLREKS